MAQSGQLCYPLFRNVAGLATIFLGESDSLARILYWPFALMFDSVRFDQLSNEVQADGCRST